MKTVIPSEANDLNRNWMKILMQATSRSSKTCY